jgi:trimethylamine--corrinoid protein Co-methyltransferase
MVMPGKPTLYCVLPSVADIRNAGYAPGAIETGILTMGSAQMARYYQIPSGGFIGQTNSKNNDAQSGFEPGMSTMASLLAGLDFFFLGGLLDAMMTFDYAKVVIDSEIALMLRQTNRGIMFNEDDLEQDFDVVMETGPGGIFTDKIHTRDRMRITALLPNIADRMNFQQWENSGKPDVRIKAMRMVYKLFSHNNPAVFSPDLDSQIRSRFTDLVSGDFQPLIPYQII